MIDSSHNRSCGWLVVIVIGSVRRVGFGWNNSTVIGGRCLNQNPLNNSSRDSHFTGPWLRVNIFTRRRLELVMLRYIENIDISFRYRIGRLSGNIFTALHEMQTRSSDENSVCLSVRLSVCPSVCHTRDPWQNGRKIGPDFYTIRKNIYPSFLRRRMVGGGRPILREILGQPTPVGTKSPIFNQWSLVAFQP